MASNWKKFSIVLTAAVFLSLPVAAADSQPPMKCMAGKEMQCDMAKGMGDMRERMGRMQASMERCSKGEAHCDKDSMMQSMKDMQDHMGQMMKNMMAMPDEQKAPSQAPAQPEDHSQHHPDSSSTPKNK